MEMVELAEKVTPWETFKELLRLKETMGLTTKEPFMKVGPSAMLLTFSTRLS